MAVLQTFYGFFDLPGELRKQILGYLLIKKHGISCGLMRGVVPPPAVNLDDGDDYKVLEEGTPAWPVNYFLVSQAFKSEATAIYFRENTFRIVATGRKCVSNPHKDIGALRNPIYFPKVVTFFPGAGEALLNKPKWAHFRRRIRKAVLYILLPRGTLEKDIFEPILDMILAGELRCLDVRICFFNPRGQRMLSSSPMRALYRVLSDPDLDHVRLRVAAGLHEDIWCVFHDGGGDGYEFCRAERIEEQESMSGWVDIDVGKLIQTHGGGEDQLRIFKVGD